MSNGKPTFRWDLDNGEGSIGNLEKFRQLDPLMRCDLLTDWIAALDEEHDFASKELMQHWMRIQNAARETSGSR